MKNGGGRETNAKGARGSGGGEGVRRRTRIIDRRFVECARDLGRGRDDRESRPGVGGGGGGAAERERVSYFIRVQGVPT